MQEGSKVKVNLPNKESRNGVVVGQYNVPDRMWEPIKSNAGAVVRDDLSSWQSEYIKVGPDIIRLD